MTEIPEVSVHLIFFLTGVFFVILKRNSVQICGLTTHYTMSSNVSSRTLLETSLAMSPERQHAAAFDEMNTMAQRLCSAGPRRVYSILSLEPSEALI